MQRSTRVATSAKTQTDKRLERLFDYTKFHIGVYITFTTGFVGLLVAASDPTSELNGILKAVEQRWWWIVVAAGLMAIAGVAGGVITSGLTQCHTFDEFWLKKHGPYNLPVMPGQWWSRFEHSAFWLSLGVGTFSLLSV